MASKNCIHHQLVIATMNSVSKPREMVVFSVKTQIITHDLSHCTEEITPA